jgi:superfamily II DNA or RNA helicase
MIELDYCDKKQKGIVKGNLLNEIREFFSEKNEAAKFLKHRFRFIPQRKYAITPSGRYHPGLTKEIIAYLKEFFPQEKINITTNLIKALIPSKQWPSYTDNQILDLSLKLYDYQEDVVKKCLEIGRGTVVLATAGGKTLITSSLINHLRNTVYKDRNSFKCVFIVPSLSLVEQTIDKFKEYGVNFTYSKWTGNNELNIAADVIVCNLGIMQSKNTNLSFLETIDLLIIDECHMLRQGNNFNKIIDIIKTPHKFGFTGTLPESNIDKWNIIGKIGPLLYERKSYELRKDKFVSNAQISILDINYKTKPITGLNTMDKYRAELDFIINNEYRNRVISKVSQNANNNILIMVDFIRHGEKIHNILSQNIKDKEIYFIQGSVETEVREKIRKWMEYKNNIVCIAISKIFSTGIDIKNLHYIIFAGGGKAKIKILQSIGRGLRLHKDKKMLQIIDIHDQLHYSADHGKKRIKFYEQEKIPYQKTSFSE